MASGFDCKKTATQIEQKYGLPSGLVYSAAKNESSCDPARVGQNTKKGPALGIMQIITAYHPGVNPFDPVAAMDYYGQKMKSMYIRCGSWDAAIASWNTGENNVLKAGCKVPNITDPYNHQTVQEYVDKINRGIKGIFGSVSSNPKKPINLDTPVFDTENVRRYIILGAGLIVIALALLAVFGKIGPGGTSSAIGAVGDTAKDVRDKTVGAIEKASETAAKAAAV